MGMVVGYYTPGLYEQEARRLQRSLERLALAYHLEQVENRGDWDNNTRYKATWLRAIRERLAGQLLYLDVDAYVHSDPWPFLQNLREDIAVHYLRDQELLSGTILLNDTPGCRLLLERWESLCRSRKDWDQHLLAEVLIELGAKVVFDHLPPEYTFIFDLMRRTHGNLPPVIEHLQASREYHQAAGSPPWLRRRRRLKELEGQLSQSPAFNLLQYSPALDNTRAVEAERQHEKEIVKPIPFS